MEDKDMNTDLTMGWGTALAPARAPRAGRLLLLFAGLLLLAGCATLLVERPPPVRVSQIVEMSRAGVPAHEIIEKIRASGTVYRLKASQLAELREKGVPDAVIDYMQQTYLHAVRRDQRFEDWNRWSLYDDGYWYGGYPFGWPYWDEDMD
jgi:hypothetical protein